MSVNTGDTPRHVPDGKYQHECAYCGVSFRTNRASDRYCCFSHKSAASNRRFYRAHRREMILRVLLKRKTPSVKPLSSRAPMQTPNFDAMDNEALLAWVRENPDKFKVKRR